MHLWPSLDRLGKDGLCHLFTTAIQLHAVQVYLYGRGHAALLNLSAVSEDLIARGQIQVYIRPGAHLFAAGFLEESRHILVVNPDVSFVISDYRGEAHSS